MVILSQDQEILADSLVEIAVSPFVHLCGAAHIPLVIVTGIFLEGFPALQ